MKHIGFYIAIMIIVISCSNRKGNDRIIRELNNQIIELPGNMPLEYTDAFLNNLIDWNKYSVIGLGEAAHDAKNFFELKHRLFKYLVENHNYKVLAYEFSFRTSLRIDKYVTKGIGDLDSLFAGELWIQDNYEVQNLIQWMRNYNTDKQENDKIHFVGIDNQLDAFYPEKTIKHIKDYFPEIILFNNSLIAQIINLEHIRYKNITTQEYERRRDLYLELLKSANNYFKEKQEYLETLDYKITIHLIESLLNSNQWLYNIYTGKKNNRDSDMANNLLWVKDCYNSKIAIWAHNAHVQNNPDFYSEGGAMMGKYLKDSLKEDYLIVLTSFTNGKFKAVMEAPDGSDTPPLDCEIFQNPPIESVNAIFIKAKYENFFLDLNQVQSNSKLYYYLDTLRPMLGVGDFYAGFTDPHYFGDRIINLTKSTNVVFYFSGTKSVTVHKRFNKK